MFFNADDDYIESYRAYLYPKLHPFLDAVGLYSIGKTFSNQFVGTVSVSEEVFEKELVDAGFHRNPIACYKSTKDGRKSEGSWVLLPEKAGEGIGLGSDRQLHLTLFPRRDGQKGREIYAHEEYDWRDKPIAHLRGKHFSPKAGVAKARQVFDSETYFTFQ